MEARGEVMRMTIEAVVIKKDGTRIDHGVISDSDDTPEEVRRPILQRIADKLREVNRG